jgi:hypothetical protein
VSDSRVQGDRGNFVCPLVIQLATAHKPVGLRCQYGPTKNVPASDYLYPTGFQGAQELLMVVAVVMNTLIPPITTGANALEESNNIISCSNLHKP